MAEALVNTVVSVVLTSAKSQCIAPPVASVQQDFRDIESTLEKSDLRVCRFLFLRVDVSTQWLQRRCVHKWKHLSWQNYAQ